MVKLWTTAIEVIGVGLTAVAVMLVVGVLLAACTTNRYEMPPSQITTVQPVQTPQGTTAVLVTRPIAGQKCWQQAGQWYCQPTT